MTPTTTAARIEIRRGADRPVTTGPGLRSRHSFAFGHHGGTTHHGLLLAHNEDRLAPGAGYDGHTHRDTEIVTWVVSGTLTHRDLDPPPGVPADTSVPAGSVQCLGAGRGLTHTEVNDDPADPLHLVQMWLPPDEPGLAPQRAQADRTAALAAGGLVTVAAGRDLRTGAADRIALRLAVRSAALHVARLPAGGAVEVPAAPFAHVFVARGELRGGGYTLAAGDALRTVAAGPLPLHAITDSEVLVWEMHEDLRPPS